MTAATSPDAVALLASIRADPEDDTVRLAYADWLEENGDADRAEFVRVQVELAKCGPEPFVVEEEAALGRHGPNYFTISNGARVKGGGVLAMEIKPGDRLDILKPSAPLRSRKSNSKPKFGLRVSKELDGDFVLVEDAQSFPWQGRKLRARESALLTQYRTAWEPCPCPRCIADPGWVPAPENHNYMICPRKKCPACGGSGDLLKHFDPTRDRLQDLLRPLTWHRGFPTMAVALGDVATMRVSDVVPAANRYGIDIETEPTPTPWALAVRCGTDVVGLEVSGLEPMPIQIGKLWYWPQDLPDWVLTDEVLLGHPTRAAAVAALNSRLSGWLWGWGRDGAGE